MKTRIAADPGFVLRPVRLPDMADLVAMIRELADFEHLSAEVKISPALLSKALFGPGRVAYGLIALVGGKPAGYAIYYLTFSTFVGRPGIYLEDIYVRPSCRKRGIGTAFMNRIAKTGSAKGYQRYEWTTLRWNKTARQLYKRLGARELREWILLRTDVRKFGKPAKRSND